MGNILKGDPKITNKFSENICEKPGQVNEISFKEKGSSNGVYCCYESGVIGVHSKDDGQ
jgi:hypothetical protein